jgi:hypothetical protein
VCVFEGEERDGELTSSRSAFPEKTLRRNDEVQLDAGLLGSETERVNGAMQGDGWRLEWSCC